MKNLSNNLETSSPSGNKDSICRLNIQPRDANSISRWVIRSSISNSICLMHFFQIKELLNSKSSLFDTFC